MRSSSPASAVSRWASRSESASATSPIRRFGSATWVTSTPRWCSGVLGTVEAALAVDGRAHRRLRRRRSLGTPSVPESAEADSRTRCSPSRDSEWSGANRGQRTKWSSVNCDRNSETSGATVAGSSAASRPCDELGQIGGVVGRHAPPHHLVRADTATRPPASSGSPIAEVSRLARRSAMRRARGRRRAAGRRARRRATRSHRRPVYTGTPIASSCGGERLGRAHHLGRVGGAACSRQSSSVIASAAVLAASKLAVRPGNAIASTRSAIAASLVTRRPDGGPARLLYALIVITWAPVVRADSATRRRRSAPTGGRRRTARPRRPRRRSGGCSRTG